MNFKKITTLGTGAVLSLGLIGGAATMALAESHAKSDDASEAQAFLAAPGSITEAIAAAETKSGGKAMSAEFGNDGEDAGMYDVEVVMADGSMSDWLVNPADGTVKASMDDDGEENDDGEKSDGDGETND